MKKIVFLFLLAFLLVSCAPVPMFVPLPEGTKVTIDVLVVAILALGIEFAVSKLPFLAFLKAYAQEWGLMLSAVLIPVIENFLPGGVFAEASVTGVQFVLAVIAAILASRKFLAKRSLFGFKE